MVRVPAFQAGYAGSIPVTRSDDAARRTVPRRKRSPPPRGFWAEALQWEIEDETSDEVVLVPTDDTTFHLRFSPSTEPKVGKNRTHIDLTSTSIEDQRRLAGRLIELGGRDIDVGQSPSDEHIVLADPEGNELCIIEPQNRFLANMRTIRIDHL